MKNDNEEKDPKTIEHDPSPYNWYIKDGYDAFAAVVLIAAFIYWHDEIKAIADWLVGNG